MKLGLLLISYLIFGQSLANGALDTKLLVETVPQCGKIYFDEQANQFLIWKSHGNAGFGLPFGYLHGQYFENGSSKDGVKNGLGTLEEAFQNSATSDLDLELAKSGKYFSYKLLTVQSRVIKTAPIPANPKKSYLRGKSFTPHLITDLKEIEFSECP